MPPPTSQSQDIDEHARFAPIELRTAYARLYTYNSSKRQQLLDMIVQQFHTIQKVNGATSVACDLALFQSVHLARKLHGHDATVKTQTTYENVTYIPAWAWVLFGVSITLGLGWTISQDCLTISLLSGCAYFGNCVTESRWRSSNRLPVSMMARRPKGWSAGFGGGLMKFGELL